MTVDKKLFHINLSILFTRLDIIAEPDDNLVDHFQVELTQEPISLFKDGMMQKPDKSVLGNVLLSKTCVSSFVASNMYVIDGGALLHRVMRPQRAT